MCVCEVAGSVCQALAAGGGGGGGAHRPAHLAALIHLARHAPLAAVLQAGLRQILLATSLKPSFIE